MRLDVFGGDRDFGRRPADHAVHAGHKLLRDDRRERQQPDAKPIDYSDIPPLGDQFFTKATTAWPPTKKPLTIRLDADVLARIKGQGRGCQTRINRILRVAMESQPPRPAQR